MVQYCSTDFPDPDLEPNFILFHDLVGLSSFFDQICTRKPLSKDQVHGVLLGLPADFHVIYSRLLGFCVLASLVIRYS